MLLNNDEHNQPAPKENTAEKQKLHEFVTYADAEANLKEVRAHIAEKEALKQKTVEKSK